MGYLTPGQDFTDFRTFLIFEISFLSGSCRLCLKIDFTISIRQNLKNMCAAAICTHTQNVLIYSLCRHAMMLKKRRKVLFD